MRTVFTAARHDLEHLTVLSQDILSVPDEILLRTQGLYTIVDGRIGFGAGT